MGSGTPYHIDFKARSDIPLEDVVKAFDAKARRMKELGRVIEFSNTGVSDKRYDLSAPLEQRTQLLRQAAAAHAPRQGWLSFDYYNPLAKENRWGKSVEGASIYLPGIPGGKVRRGTSGDYGFYSEALDPSGNVKFKIGHGDTRRPEEGAEMLVPMTPNLPSSLGTAATPPAQTADTSTAEKKTDPMRYALFQSLLSQMNQPSLADQILEQEINQTGLGGFGRLPGMQGRGLLG
jgi:hypothetical protein